MAGRVTPARLALPALIAALAPAGPLGAQEDDLAKQLSNPVADLVSVPFQLNLDSGLGPESETERLTFNIQPVVPIELNARWNLISRTIVPLVSLEGPGVEQAGVGDVLQSFFFSPKTPSPGGWVWGAGPAILVPSGDDALSGDTFALGPTGVVLRQQGPWSYGGLFNHLWSVGGDTEIDQTFLQPFVSYATPGGTTFSLNSEATYDWTDETWSVPLNAQVSQVFRIGQRPVSAGFGLRYWADSPEGGPEGWAARLTFTLIYPKG